MNKHIFPFFIALIAFTAPAYSFSSSSYLITNTAVKFFDYKKAYSHIPPKNENLNEIDLHNKLLTLTNLNFIDAASKIAKQILETNKLNQEAWVVYLAGSKLKNSPEAFNELNLIKLKEEIPLVNYVFFNSDGTIKSIQASARSLYEIAQSSLTDPKFQDVNYNFILFYLKISNILDPSFYEGYYYSAQIYQFLKQFEQAESLYNMIPSTHSLYFESIINIALNKSKMNKFAEGEAYLSELINQHPNEGSLLIALGDLYRFQKIYDQAIKYYSDIINTKKDNLSEKWRLLYLRGICYERSSQWALAEIDFLESLKLKSDSPQVLNYLAYGWLELDQHLDRALQMLQKAYAGNPNSYYILDSLAWAYYKKNNLDKAVQLMEEVIFLAPGEAISLDHLGDIYFALNRKREASYLWEQAKDLAEPDENITESLEKKLEEYYAG
jgi:Flp pilus assembly protein TadD